MSLWTEIEFLVKFILFRRRQSEHTRFPFDDDPLVLVPDSTLLRRSPNSTDFIARVITYRRVALILMDDHC